MALPLPLQLQRRRSAKYEPAAWDYHSICSLPTHTLPHLGSQQQEEEEEDAAIDNRLHLLKDSIRRTLQLPVLQEEEEDDTSCRLRLLLRTIHQLQTLGIAYHFHQEIRGILMSIHHHQHQLHLDLHSAALLFTILRGLGIPASTDMLMSALREQGDKITDDSDALLALCQASYLAFPGETVLDQAKAFAVGKLSAGGRDDDHDSDWTHHLPSLPLHWAAPRLQAMWSLSLIKQDDDDTVDPPAILQLAQVDFNLVQALHRGELAEVTRWWKESRLGEGDDCSSFACRDRVVECFFCAACIAPEPGLAECREALAKTGAIMVHLDDIYDVYGTLDELRAFTHAIGRWAHDDDADAMDMDQALPEYMKAMYSAIRTTSVTAADRVLQKHGYDDMLPLYKKAWHDLCKAFLVEAQWQQQGHTPSFAEYVSNGWVTSTGPLLLLHALPAAGIPITQTTHQANGNGIDYPRLVELSSTIFRLCNDCASHEAESERGDAPSSIACFTAEPWCTGEDQARAAVQGVIAETWKALNWEVVVAASGSGGNDSSSAAETTMANLCLNLARITYCIYQDGHGITSPTHRIKQMVKGLLFNPIASI